MRYPVSYRLHPTHDSSRDHMKQCCCRRKEVRRIYPCYTASAPKFMLKKGPHASYAVLWHFLWGKGWNTNHQLTHQGCRQPCKTQGVAVSFSVNFGHVTAPFNITLKLCWIGGWTHTGGVCSWFTEKTKQKTKNPKTKQNQKQPVAATSCLRRLRVYETAFIGSLCK